MSPLYYLQFYTCSNCSFGYLVTIPFKKESTDNLECLNCGMEGVCKTEKDIRVDGKVLLEDGVLIWNHLNF